MKLIIHKIDTPYLVGPVDIFELWINDKHLLIDTGPPTKQARQQLLDQIDLKSLDYLLLTHCHPDHYGLAQFILDHSPAELLIAKVDSLLAELFPQRIAFLKKTFRDIHIPDPLLRQLDQIAPRFQGDIPFPKNYTLLEDSAQLLEELGISYLSCPGHSQSDIIYMVQGKAFTGDILLRNIFSAPLLDMDLTAEQGRFLNYEAYTQSILKLEQLKGFEIMPSHNDWIPSVNQQILFYCHKIIQRSRKIAPLFGEQGPLYETLTTLFSHFFEDPFKLYIKLGELYFLNDYLNNPDRLHQSLEQLGLREALGV